MNLLDSARFTKLNLLEAPPASSKVEGWSLTAEEFMRRAKGQLSQVWKAAREETLSVTEAIGKVEAEIDERVKSLYGVG